ncbi:cell wall-binding repeat-containing protein [Citroniella saccharovorans]|uniref:Cell wall-binding repeat-containing protein n=1 Tax=Citroniella saccharovorans TaxID=2053367 RepID=A0AAW9MTF9_9FIRM|nr:cell wall-binding repeat-containing protein [Citroniella saccharovorans]MEB3429138.1 cell wall-binding repeat-containing protein [Citroniella saccharovorans]
MKKNFKKISLILAALVLICQISFASTKINTNRISGEDRYETNLLINTLYLKLLSRPGKTFDSFVMVSGENYPDALAAAVYATKKQSALLLTPKDKVLDSTSKFIKDNAFTDGIFVGGSETLSKDLYLKVNSFVPNLRRIFGKDRNDTSALLSTESKLKFITNGSFFADALAVGPLVIYEDGDLLLTGQTTSLDGIAVGGENSLKGSFKDRISGEDRYKTSIEIAKRMPPSNTFILCSGENYPDALSSGILAGIKSIPILLTEPNKLNKDVKDFIYEKGYINCIIVGGKNSISKAVEDEIKNMNIENPSIIGDLNPINPNPINPNPIVTPGEPFPPKSDR